MRSILFLAVTVGCQAETVPDSWPFEKAPNFSLMDENYTSVTFGEQVSPRDAIGMVSVWYFGHSD